MEKLHLLLLAPKRVSRNIVVAMVVTFSFSLALLPLQVARAVTSPSLSLSEPRPTLTSQYTMTVSSLTAGTIGCIEVDLGSSADGTGTPTGLNTGSATLVSQNVASSGSWSVSNAQSAAHKLRATSTGGTTDTTANRSVVFGAVTNGSTAGTAYYAIFTTYTDNTCATPVDTATVQFIYTEGQAVSLTVDPSLSFTVAGTANATACNGATSNVTTTANTIPFGTVTSSTNKIGVQNLTVTTNAGNGYTVHTRYTQPPTSGSNTIDDHTGTNASPTAFSAAGTEAFGYTTNDSSLGSGTANRFTSTPNVWAAYTTSNAEVAYSNAAASSQTTCVGHQVGVSGTTPAGSYLSTVVYTATPIY